MRSQVGDEPINCNVIENSRGGSNSRVPAQVTISFRPAADMTNRPIDIKGHSNRSIDSDKHPMSIKSGGSHRIAFEIVECASAPPRDPPKSYTPSTLPRDRGVKFSAIAFRLFTFDSPLYLRYPVVCITENLLHSGRNTIKRPELTYPRPF